MIHTHVVLAELLVVAAQHHYIIRERITLPPCWLL
jgi:hypothetical protein